MNPQITGWLASGLAALVVAPATAASATIEFSTDPFAGTTALTTPGRQIVGNELFAAFDPATDTFQFDAAAFGVPTIRFANDAIDDLPTEGVNTVVLRTFDDDANPATPFGAGSAAALIAARFTSPGAGFFIYFNSGLDLPRLVFSTDLSDGLADLKILARLTNLGGQPGRDALTGFGAGNFAVVQAAPVPEPGTLGLLALGVLGTRLATRRARGSHIATGGTAPCSPTG